MEELVHQKASTKKRIFSVLIDYFLVMVLTVILYFILVSQVANIIPSFKEISNNFYQSYETLSTLVDDSKLNTLTSDSFIKMSIKSTLGEDYFYTNEYNMINPLSKDNDSLYYYFSTFKEEHHDEYTNINSVNLNYLFNYFSSANFYHLENDYYVLNEEIALKVGDFLFNANDSNKNSYNELNKYIDEIFNFSVNDLKENNLVYKTNYTNINNLSNSITIINFLEINISFVLSYIIAICLPLLINKKHKSLGDIIMKISPKFKKKTCKNQLFIKLITFIFVAYSSIFISLILTSGTSYGQILISNLSGFYYVLFILVLSIMISLFSLLLEFLPFSKSSLSDYFASIIKEDDLRLIKNE